MKIHMESLDLIKNDRFALADRKGKLGRFIHVALINACIGPTMLVAVFIEGKGYEPWHWLLCAMQLAVLGYVMRRFPKVMHECEWHMRACASRSTSKYHPEKSSHLAL